MRCPSPKQPLNPVRKIQHKCWLMSKANHPEHFQQWKRRWKSRQLCFSPEICPKKVFTEENHWQESVRNEDEGKDDLVTGIFLYPQSAHSLWQGLWVLKNATNNRRHQETEKKKKICKLRLIQLFPWPFGIVQGQHLFKIQMATKVKMKLMSGKLSEGACKMTTVPSPLQIMKMLKSLQMMGLGNSKVLSGRREWDGRGSSLPWLWNINHPGMKIIWGCKCRGMLLVQLSFPLPGGNRAINALQTQDKQHKEWFIPSTSHSSLFLVISSLQNTRVWTGSFF